MAWEPGEQLFPFSLLWVLPSQGTYRTFLTGALLVSGQEINILLLIYYPYRKSYLNEETIFQHNTLFIEHVLGVTVPGISYICKEFRG